MSDETRSLIYYPDTEAYGDKAGKYFDRDTGEEVIVAPAEPAPTGVSALLTQLSQATPEEKAALIAALAEPSPLG